MNFNKEGYSVPEVAQILGCTPQTVRTYIERGSLGCLSHQPGESGRVWRRITREQLYKYLKANPDRYSKELINSFAMKSELDPETNAQTVKTNEPSIVDNNGHKAYSASNLSELKGAWGESSESIRTNAEDTEANKTSSQVPLEQYGHSPSYSVSVDGRIAIGNLENRTVSTIVAALLDDRQCQFSTVTVTKTLPK